MPNLDKDFDKYLTSKGFDPESAKKDRRYWVALFDAEKALQEAFSSEMSNAMDFIEDILKPLPEDTKEDVDEDNNTEEVE